ncbi:hypothetical protein KP77_27630 [Jeotgalibacillus alimentarius]|uniref:Uncharacterized protein n=1 Tax=Jeotgalibacillus alimentarius TaxID=135826 RepID=A0A0C2VQC9_9BACL|nr:hypothetical protein [Jeotgalibacillus alimentarius]KIL46636.1 hypothetical protein KP77_27630 [Jeotgalibacillus alimentarius]
MKKDNWELNISYDDYSYQVTGDFKNIEEHLSLAINHLQKAEATNEKMKFDLRIYGKAPSKIEELSKVNQTTIEIDTELKSFVDSLGTRIEWIYCLGLSYYANMINQNNIATAKSLKTLYTAADIRPPQNIHLCINQCVRKKYLQPIGKSVGQKAYYITDEGITFIEQQIQKGKTSQKELEYESEEQKEAVETFISTLSKRDSASLNQMNGMSEKILLMMYLMKKTGLTKPVRPHLIYMLMVRVFGYDGLPRSVHLGLSRTRPLTKKVKLSNKVHYMLTQEGIDWAEEKAVEGQSADL